MQFGNHLIKVASNTQLIKQIVTKYTNTSKFEVQYDYITVV